MVDLPRGNLPGRDPDQCFYGSLYIYFLHMQRVIIDVREPNEYATGHVEGAINIPPAALMAGSAKLAGVPKETELVLYCVSGSRSNVSMNLLRAQGYNNLVNGINMHHVQKNYL